MTAAAIPLAEALGPLLAKALGWGSVALAGSGAMSAGRDMLQALYLNPFTAELSEKQAKAAFQRQMEGMNMLSDKQLAMQQNLWSQIGQWHEKGFKEQQLMAAQQRAHEMQLAGMQGQMGIMQQGMANAAGITSAYLGRQHPDLGGGLVNAVRMNLQAPPG
jgi:hypothetical protein